MSSEPRSPSNRSTWAQRDLIRLLAGSLLGVTLNLQLLAGLAEANSSRGATMDPLIIPSPTNSIQFRLCTSPAPESRRVFNCFELVGFGGTFVPSFSKTPGAELPAPQTLVNGLGPNSTVLGEVRVVHRASGQDWSYLALDMSPAYAERLQEYRRGLLYIKPDLIVMYDHFAAKHGVDIKLRLQLASDIAAIDPVWHDLRLRTPGGTARIHLPSDHKSLRKWELIKPAGDDPVTALDSLVVCALSEANHQTKFDFKLLESTSAIGARIHRDGFPTLIAFKTTSDASQASITGFNFEGPVGVSVFKPRGVPVR
jgi:hypothetical protein